MEWLKAVCLHVGQIPASMEGAVWSSGVITGVSAWTHGLTMDQTVNTVSHADESAL